MLKDIALGAAYAAFNKEVQRNTTNSGAFLAGLLAVEAYHRRYQIDRFLTAVKSFREIDDWHA